MQLLGRALVHTSLLRGSGTPEFDGHVAPPLCVTCPPSSATVWRVTSADVTQHYLVHHRLCRKEATRRLGTPGGMWEHQLVWHEGFVFEILGAENAPRLWDSHGANNLGQRCLAEDRAKPWLDRLGATGARTTQEWPGRTPANIQALQSRTLRSPNPRDSRSHAL